MISNRKKFYSGAILFSAFTVVLVLIFMPLYNGHNGLEYLDSLYNSISKGSAYYIPKLRKAATDYKARSISVSLALTDEREASETRALFSSGGARVSQSGSVLKVTGDLDAIVLNCLEDADAMYANDGKRLKDKYGYDERQVLYNWWKAFKAADKDLKKQKKFAEAKFLAAVSQKAVECVYNYYTIEAQNISDRWGVVIFSLLFYVVYTLWYGFAIMNIFEGLGLRLEH